MSDGRIEIIVNEGSPGVAGALQYGLLRCRSDWVARQDADDIAHPQRLSRQLLAAVGDVCLVGSGVVTIRDDEEISWPVGSLTPPDVTAVSIRELLKWNPIAHSTALLNRQCALQAGNYRIQADGLEDYDLWLRMAAHGTIVNISEQLLAYRLHEFQRTRSRRSFKAYRTVTAAAFRTARSLGLSRTAIVRDHGFYIYRQGYLKATRLWRSFK